MSDVGVLDKVMAVLRCFPDGSTSIEPRALAARLGMPPATAYRLTKAMAEHGLLEAEGTGYRLGVTLLHLGARVADGLEVRQVAHPHLEWLRDQTQENAELHLRHGSSRVPVEVLHSRLNLRPVGQVGVPFPLHVGASAKVLLAWLEPDESEALARASLSAYDGQHELDVDQMRRRLADVRARGWAFTDGEREVGVASVAAPVRDRFGAVVAALVLAGPSSRLSLPEARETGARLTTEAAGRISRALGHLDESTTTGESS